MQHIIHHTVVNITWLISTAIILHLFEQIRFQSLCNWVKIYAMLSLTEQQSAGQTSCPWTCMRGQVAPRGPACSSLSRGFPVCRRSGVGCSPRYPHSLKVPSHCWAKIQCIMNTFSSFLLYNAQEIYTHRPLRYTCLTAYYSIYLFSQSHSNNSVHSVM